MAFPLTGKARVSRFNPHGGFIRGWAVTSASAHDAVQLRNVLNRDNTGSKAWADTAYRSKTNEA